MNTLSINTIDIDLALDYYNISDVDYKNKCYDCLNCIQKNTKLKNNFLSVYDTLYNNLSSISRPLWKNKTPEEIFGVNHPLFTTNLMLLIGYKIHKENMEIHNFTTDEINIHKLRIKQALTNDIYTRDSPQIRVSQMLWGIYIINMKIIEIGRLQYEYYKNEKEEYIKIHIPSGEKLLFENVLKSLQLSKEKIPLHFNITNYECYCTSWLLSKQILSIVPIDSNIYKFSTLFDIEEGEDCLKDILNFVYKRNYCNDLSSLEEKTLLQKIIKKYLVNENKIVIGQGKL